MATFNIAPIDTAWRNLCKILFGRDVGGLMKFEPYLKEAMMPYMIVESSVSGNDVFLSNKLYPKNARVVSPGEIPSLKNAVFNPNDIKDIDSLFRAAEENVAYCGNKVFGKNANVDFVDNALDCIAGYSCFNDGSIRNYQRKSSQWTIGKNFDATGPFGPCLVTPDELPPGAAGLRIQSRLNGKVMQDANTDVFLWNVVEALRIITECMTLEPGDVIITGTPAGVGYARTPPVWMAPGDICEIEVEGVGILSNPIVDER